MGGAKKGNREKGSGDTGGGKRWGAKEKKKKKKKIRKGLWESGEGFSEKTSIAASPRKAGRKANKGCHRRKQFARPSLYYHYFFKKRRFTLLG